MPTPEIVWWRAQMRAREQATRTAARPIVFTQALAIAALLGLLVSVIGRLSLPMFSWTDFISRQSPLPILPLALVAGCWLVLAPVALYFAFSRE